MSGLSSPENHSLQNIMNVAQLYSAGHIVVFQIWLTKQTMKNTPLRPAVRLLLYVYSLTPFAYLQTRSKHSAQWGF